jgi:hypothetical protein
MNYLRDLLKCEKPELAVALENAWAVANKEVFPAMSSSDDSINSLPHSQNLETYLNSILEPCQNLFNENSTIYLSPHELYCILTALVFHDFGRIKFEEGHGSFTKRYILNNYQKFSIPTEELAEAIAEICEIHKPLDDKTIQPATTLLDAGKGKVRVRELAGLLVLVDEMDTSYRRLKELYLLDQPKYFSGKGSFRNYIKGINYDYFTRTVYVSIDNKITESTELSKDKLNAVIFKKNKRKIKIGSSENSLNDLLDFLIKSTGTVTNEEKGVFSTLMKGKTFVEPFIPEKLIKEFRKKLQMELQKLPNNSDRKKLVTKLKDLKGPNNSGVFSKFYYYYDYYQNNFSDLKTEIERTALQKWHIFVVIPLILNAIKESESISGKTIYLSRLGIHVKKWLISYKEHLYNTDGNETIEPVLDFDYLINVVDSMWELSRNILAFEDEWYSYEVLLNKVVRLGDVRLIKLAVQRVEIITRETSLASGYSSCINYDNKKWCLLRINGRCMPLKDIKDQITKIQTNLK